MLRALAAAAAARRLRVAAQSAGAAFSAQGCDTAASLHRSVWAAQQLPRAQRASLAPARQLCTAGSADQPQPPHSSQDPAPSDSPPGAASSADAAADVNKALVLNAEIAAATSVEAVLEAMSRDGRLDERLSDWSLTSALVRIANLSQIHDTPTAWLRDDPRYLRVLDNFTPHFGTRHYNTLARAFASAARVGVCPPPAWLDAFWATTARGLPGMRWPVLADAVYGCRYLHITPPDDWMLRFWHASAEALPQYEHEALCSVLRSCGALRLVPPDYWLARFWLATEATPAANLQDLFALFDACGQLGITPPPDWLERYWRASEGVLASCMPHILRTMLTICAAMGVSPDEAWLQSCFRAWRRHVPQLNALELHKALAACSNLGITPPPEFLDLFWQACTAKLPDFAPAELSGLLASCCTSSLDIRPPRAFLAEYWREFAQRVMHAGATQQMADTLLSAAILQLWDAPPLAELFQRLEATFAEEAAGWSPSAFPKYALDAYSAYLAASAERPGLLPEPRPAVREALRSLRRALLDPAAPAGAEARADIAACLKALRVRHKGPKWCDRSEAKVDFALTAKKGAAPIALLLDQPARAYCGGRAPGRMRLRMRLLTARGGWRLAVVSASEWAQLQTPEQKAELLRRTLADAASD